jgi:hypothetical protein
MKRALIFLALLTFAAGAMDARPSGRPVALQTRSISR